MSLTNKLKNTGKALALTGMLASPVYNSGCVPVALVTSAAIIAKGNRDAAETIANANQNRQNRQTGNELKAFFYTLNCYKGDLNNNNHMDLEEIEGFNKEIFKTAERIEFGFEIYNGFGKMLNFTFYKKDNLEKIDAPGQLYINSNSYTGRRHILRSPLTPGKYMGSFEIGNQTFGVKEIEIID